MSQGVEQRWSGVGGSWEEGETGAAQGWGAIHGPGVALRHPALGWKLVLGPVSQSGLALKETNADLAVRLNHFYPVYSIESTEFHQKIKKENNNNKKIPRQSDN